MFRIKITVGLVLLVPKCIKFIKRRKNNQQNKTSTVKYLHSAHLRERLARTGPLVQEPAGQVVCNCSSFTLACQCGNEATEIPHANFALPKHRVPWHSHSQSTRASIGMGDQPPAAIGLAACQLHGKHKVENKSPPLQITAWAKENQYIVTSHCLNVIKR